MKKRGINIKQRLLLVCTVRETIIVKYSRGVGCEKYRSTEQNRNAEGYSFNLEVSVDGSIENSCNSMEN